jgi:hypothetical protein
MTYTSSSIVSMPEDAIVDVPTTIRISDEVISVFPNPSSVDGHFGETLIYAAISIGHEKDRRGPAYLFFGTNSGSFQRHHGQHQQ